MASITIRKLDDEVKTQLRLRAAANGRSMEEEARTILRLAVQREDPPAKGLATRNLRDFADTGAELIDPWAAG